MATRQRVKSALPNIHNLLKQGKLTDSQLEYLFENAVKILNDTDLQNADYDEITWQAMLEGDEGKDFTPDELTTASGEFGRNVNNPLPVNVATGEVPYLSRLMLIDEDNLQHVMFHRVGSSLNLNINRYIDIFEVMSIDGLYRENLYLDMYHVEQSKKAPSGYKLIDKITSITGESIGFNPKFPENTFERAFQYAVDIFGAPVVNSALKNN